MESSERDIIYELEGQLFVWDKIKAESNSNPFRRKTLEEVIL